MPDADDAFSIARLGWGAALLVRPREVSGLVESGEVGEKLAVAARILGARHVLQTFAERRWPASGLRRAGATIDGIHAVVMAAVAVPSTSARGPALTSSLIATGLALEQALVPERHEAGR